MITSIKMKIELFFKRNRIRSKYISFGKGFTYGTGFRCDAVLQYHSQTFTPKITFGDYVQIADFVHIGCTNRVQIGDSVGIGSKVFISDHNHGAYGDNDVELHEDPYVPCRYRKLTTGSKVIIGNNVWIGENSIILPDTEIGENAIVGAGSIVKGKVEANTIVAGAPAKPIRKYDFELKRWVRYK